MAVNIDHKLTLLANLPLRPSMATRKNGHKKLPPGLIDQWLRTNLRHPTVAFLQDYLFLKNVATEHVICLVERECVAVSYIYTSTTNPIDFYNHRPPMMGQSSKILPLTRFTSLLAYREAPSIICCCGRVLALYWRSMWGSIMTGMPQNGLVGHNPPVNSSSPRQVLQIFLCAWLCGTKTNFRYVASLCTGGK